MENKLNKLFDYQKFEQNKQLQEVINETMQLETATFLNDELLAVATGGKNITKDDKDDQC